MSQKTPTTVKNVFRPAEFDPKWREGFWGGVYVGAAVMGFLGVLAFISVVIPGIAQQEEFRAERKTTEAQMMRLYSDKAACEDRTKVLTERVQTHLWTFHGRDSGTWWDP